MNTAIGKFEVSERLRSQVAVALKSEKPWSNAVPASQVASVLETFLVERVPAVPPDYNRLKPTGADAVVELVVEEYGLRPQGTQSQSYLRGSARMFLLADNSELWRTEFQRSGEVQGLPPLDAAALVSNAGPYGDQLRTLLDATAAALAQELTPGGRLGGRPTPSGTGELATPPDAATKTEQEGKDAGAGAGFDGACANADADRPHQVEDAAPSGPHHAHRAARHTEVSLGCLCHSPSHSTAAPAARCCVLRSRWRW